MKNRALIFLALAVCIGYVERSAIAHLIPYMSITIEGTVEEWSYVLSAFGLGYVIGLAATPWILFKIRMDNALAIICFGWGLSCFLIALCTSISYVTISRFFLGVFEGPLFPIFATWIGIKTKDSIRSKSIAKVESMSYLGLALSGLIAVSIAETVNWRFSFFILGSIASVLGAFILVQRHKLDCPSPEIVSFKNDPSNEDWASLIVVLIMAALGFMMYNFMKTFFSTWQPTYLLNVFNFTSIQAAQFSFGQSMFAFVGVLTVGIISSLMVVKFRSVIIGRQVPMTLGFLFAGSVGFIPFIHSDHLAICLTFLSFVFLISVSSIIWSMPGDFFQSPRKVVFFASFFNMISNLGTLFSPIVFGYFLIEGKETQMSFVLLAMFAILACLFFSIAFFIKRGVKYES